jgi:type II secretory pathway component GspD/PulD (secretin)
MKAEELVRLLSSLGGSSGGGGGAVPVSPVAPPPTGGVPGGIRTGGGATGVFAIGGVRVMPDHNAFVLTTTEDALKQIKREIALLDIPAPQVVMETIVTEVTSSTLKELGVNFMGGEGQFTATLPGGPALVFQNRGSANDFTLTIRALVDKGKANIIANPRLATLSGREANIDVAQERFFRIGTTDFNTGGQPGQPGGVIGGFFPFVDLRQIRAGVQVRITPWVGGNGDILLDLEPTVSSITGTGPEGLPEISSRSARVTLRVRDGETLLIGGLKQKDQSRSTRKVPLVGDLPLIGNLFRSTNVNERETELLIMVTPHIIRGAAEGNGGK